MNEGSQLPVLDIQLERVAEVKITKRNCNKNSKKSAQVMIDSPPPPPSKIQQDSKNKGVNVVQRYEYHSNLPTQVQLLINQEQKISFQQSTFIYRL